MLLRDARSAPPVLRAPVEPRLPAVDAAAYGLCNGRRAGCPEYPSKDEAAHK